MENISSEYKVLFVCLGNICRSPAAQAIFEHYVREAGLQDRIQVDSAGIYGGHQGNPPDRRMRTAALYRGFAVTHTARQVKAMDFMDFDLIIAMDDQSTALISFQTVFRFQLRHIIDQTLAEFDPGIIEFIMEITVAFFFCFHEYLFETDTQEILFTVKTVIGSSRP